MSPSRRETATLASATRTTAQVVSFTYVHSRNRSVVSMTLRGPLVSVLPDGNSRPGIYNTSSQKKLA